MNKKWMTIFLLALVVLFVAGCRDKITDTSAILKLNITGLVDLGATAKYEAWIMVNGVPESIGKFTVNNDSEGVGHMSITTFSVEKSFLEEATACFVTIEPLPDPSPNHSNNILLAGDFGGTVGDSIHTNPSIATLDIGHRLALNNYFTSALGKYTLDSPTDSNTLNSSSGVWFKDISTGVPRQGLTIPELPDTLHWKYEAWATFNGITISMGKFKKGNQSDESGTYSGTDFLPPPYPGEDFVNNAVLSALGITVPVTMSGKIITITIEPDPDFSPEPFFLTILKAAIASDAAPSITYPMTNQAVNSTLIGRATR